VNRFAPHVEAALRAAGWTPGRSLGRAALDDLHQRLDAETGRWGAQLDRSAAADRILDEFGGLTLEGSQAIDYNPRPVALDPTLTLGCVDTLADLGRVLETTLYPLGVEGLLDGLLAVTGDNEVIMIDAVGEWFLGDSIETALDTMLSGRQPVRITDDGHWPGPDRQYAADEDRDVSLPIGAAFFFPRSASNPHQVWLPWALKRLQVTPDATSTRPGRVEFDWGGLSCEGRVIDLPTTTVLLIVFNEDAYHSQLAEHQEPHPDSPDAMPLAGAFRQACVDLQPDLRVGLVQTLRPAQLDRWVTGFEEAFQRHLTQDFLAEPLSMLYLDDDFAQGLPVQPGRDELTVPNGARLFFAGTGVHRW
jgi:hypothetical protein